MADIADHPVPTIESLTDYQRAGHSWVAVDAGRPDDGRPDDGRPDDGRPDDGRPDDGRPDDGRPVGFILVKVVDGAAHIEQVSVDPAHAHRRIGRDLIDHVEDWAAAQDLRRALTLTTFRDVQWNGPYYERLGFTVLAPADHGPELASLMADEAAHGLDPAHRIAMRRPIHHPR
ncbi:GNAT family N-acetyltransferase [Actinoplanes sp. NPDC049599]|uniref:GNAT family N-acetyltransferase n=1 Tax=Actinoplanes sp. NPDC049599 TaxID=3363903 RepID=UPI0037938CB1